MKLEDQVASLELAKQLKELGFPQFTCFMWHVEDENGVGVTLVHMMESDRLRIGVVGEPDWVAAPTLAEMGEWLPCPDIITVNDLNGWHIRTHVPGPHSENCRTEAEARAKLLISFVDAGLLETSQLS